MESSFSSGLGFGINIPTEFRKDGYLYSEAGGRIVVSVKEEKALDFANFLQQKGFPHVHLGEVQGKQVIIDGEILDQVSEYQKIYDGSLGEKLS